jgi:hypothetical protein
MKEYLDQLKSELRRAEHLFYVSLKYTRTVDVIRSVVERLMNAYEIGIEALLIKTKKRRKTLEIPDQMRKKCELTKEIYPKDEKLIMFVDFYLQMRDIFQAKYDVKEEYRRHVAMISQLEPGQIVEVNIDLLQEYYNRTKEFEEYMTEQLT